MGNQESFSKPSSCVNDAATDEKTEVNMKDGRILVKPGTMMDEHLLLGPMMDRGGIVQPTSEIVTMLDGKGGYHVYNYKEHNARSWKLASAFKKGGLQIGDVVSTFMVNTARHLELYHSVPGMGGILNPINIRLHPDAIGYIMTNSGTKVICVDAMLLPVLQKVPEKYFKDVTAVIVCGMNMKPGGWESTMKNTVDYDEFLSTGDDGKFEWPNLHENSGAYMCYTSGTTGNAKGCCYTHRSTVLHAGLANMTNDAFNLSALDCLLSIVPLFHALGWCMVPSTCMLGTKTIMNGPFAKPEQLLSAFIDHGVTLTCGVPTVWQGMMLHLKKDENKEVREKLKKTLNRMAVGGTAPAPALIKWWNTEMGVEFIQGWGMTEMNPLGTISRARMTRRHLTCDEEERINNPSYAGMFCHTVQYKLVNPENFDEEVAQDGKAVGELLVKGPWVTARYWNTDAGNFHKGWLCTGDIATIDEQKILHITDRSKDLIKSGGEWISSKDMENHVIAIDGIVQCAVVGVKHPKWIERPVVVAKLAPEAKVTLEQVREHCKSKFAKFQLPSDIVVWDEIPIGGTGKISKLNIRKKLTADGYVLPDLRKAGAAAEADPEAKE